MPQREVVIERLSRAFAEDGITLDEFERRAELVYRAASTSELQVLVADLPAAPEPVDASGKKSVARMGEGDRITTLLGSTERRMPGPMPRYLRIRTMLGNTELDLRHATFEPGVTEINVRCLMGNVELTVPDGVRVEILCTGVLANVGSTGLFDSDTEHQLNANVVASTGGGDASVVPAVATQPPRILRVTGRALFANVEIHKGEKGRREN